MNDTHLLQSLRESTSAFLSTIGLLDNESLNWNATPDTWCAGAIAEHIYKSDSFMIQVLFGSATTSDRAADLHAETIRSLFLDFNTKFEAPEFIYPSEKEYEKGLSLDCLNGTRRELFRAAEELDLSQICTSFDFPSLGLLSRFELLVFVDAHTRRHVHQLEKILKLMKDESLTL